MDNNQKMADIMRQYGLSHKRLAEILMTTPDTTRAWTCNPKSTRYRKVSDQTLKLLKMLIAAGRYKKVEE